jgi:hypothetical protein
LSAAPISEFSYASAAAAIGDLVCGAALSDLAPGSHRGARRRRQAHGSGRRLVFLPRPSRCKAGPGRRWLLSLTKR